MDKHSPQLISDRRLYLIIVDGLRADFGRRYFAGLNRRVAGGRAAYTTLRSGLPSDSRPSYALIATGVDGCVNTITSNGVRHRCPTPNIFGIARQAGLTTGGALYHWWSELFNKTPFDPATDREQRDPARDIQDGCFYDADETPDDVVFQQAAEIRRRSRPHLLVIHPMSVDYAGDRLGGAAAEPYRQNTMRVGQLIDAWIEEVLQEEPSATFIVTADHGARDEGGHGGDSDAERLVPCWLLGPGVRPAVDERVYDQRALAPTILTLLGLDIPPHMEVPPLAGLLR